MNPVDNRVDNENRPPAMTTPLRPQHLAIIGDELAIAWNDGTESFITLERLRRECPCAVCQGEGDLTNPATKPLTTYGTASFTLRSWQFIGGYAWQPTWADGHNSGLYPFQLIKKLANSAQAL